MSFSTGFNNTFRSLDNAFQWRASQKENARQFDTTFGENQRQFDATHDERTRVNDSLIDLNTARIQNVREATKAAEFANQFAEQTLADRVAQEANARRLGQLNNDHQSMLNDRVRLTQDSAIRAANSKFDLETYTNELSVATEQGKQSDFMLAHLDDDPAVIAADPKRASALLATLTAAGAGTGVGMDVATVVVATDEDGNLILDEQGRHMYQGIGKRAGGKGFEADTDEDGIVSQDELAEYLAQVREQLATKANAAGRNETFRRNAERYLGAGASGGQAPARPQAPAGPQLMSEDIQAMEAEGSKLAAELERIQSDSKVIANVIGKLIESGQEKGAQEYAERYKELSDREQQIEAQLKGINDSLQGGMAPAPEQGNRRTLADITQSAVSDFVSRAQAGQRLDGARWGTTQLDNMAATGSPNVSAKDAATIQKDARKAFDDMMENVVTAGGYVKYEDPKTGKVTQVNLSNTQGQAIKRQVMLLLDRGDPVISRLARDSYRLEELAAQVGDATYGGKLPPVVSAELTQMYETVSAKDVGAVAARIVNVEGINVKDMSRDQLEDIYLRAARVVSEGGGVGDVKAAAGRALGQR